MAPFEGYRGERVRYALNCETWDKAGSRRHSGLAAQRAAQRRGEARDRAIRAYAREHQCSRREAEDALFGEDE
jgi:hypothetical protein